MKLLFDQHLSVRLVNTLADLFPGSNQLRPLGLDRVDDDVIWRFARDQEFIIVSKDRDLNDLAIRLGPPPKVIWLRVGNCPTSLVGMLLRDRYDAIRAFVCDPDAAVLVVDV